MLEICSLSRRVMLEEWMTVLRVHRKRNKSDKWNVRRKARELVGMLEDRGSEESVRRLGYPNQWPLRQERKGRQNESGHE